MIVNLKHTGDMSFVAEGPSGFPVTMDSPRANEAPAGPSPMELVLMALGGCTSMDVVSILEKMKVRFSDLWVEINGEMAPAHPKVYTDIRMVFHFTGREEDRPSFEKAITLSQERYCSVSVHLQKMARISWEIVIHPEQVGSVVIGGFPSE